MCQISLKSLQPQPKYRDFSIFQRWRPPPPWILKFQIFSGGDGQEGRTTSPRQISLKSAKTRPRYGDLSIFKITAAAILDFKNFNFFNGRGGRSRGSNCIIVPNFVKIGPTTAEICRFFYFSRWRSPPSWIFEISNF